MLECPIAENQVLPLQAHQQIDIYADALLVRGWLRTAVPAMSRRHRGDKATDGTYEHPTFNIERPTPKPMTTISTHEAKTHLSRYLAQVEKGHEFIIARGKHPVARLVPLETPAHRPRPKVGEMLGEPFDIPDEALAPISEKELREEWALWTFCWTPARSSCGQSPDNGSYASRRVQSPMTLQV